MINGLLLPLPNLAPKALLQAALERPDDEDGDEVVREEDQKSLVVGIVGAPNAGKSALTNYMVGTKVSVVSRKTNTTNHEILGVITEAETQIASCFQAMKVYNLVFVSGVLGLIPESTLTLLDLILDPILDPLKPFEVQKCCICDDLDEVSGE